MVNVASVMRAIVAAAAQSPFSPVDIATTESNQDDQREPDYPLSLSFCTLCVCMCVLKPRLKIVAYM